MFYNNVEQYLCYAFRTIYVFLINIIRFLATVD
jgi:hypothetical protein